MGTVHPTVRVAILQTGPIAGRAASVLLSDPDLESLGVFDQDPGSDPRIQRVTDLTEWDLLLSDTNTPERAVALAVDASVPLVLSEEFDQTVPVPVFAGASLIAVAKSLALELSTPTSVAVTTTGTPLRRGERVLFPPPVGSLRASPRPDGLLLAPTDTDWGGVMIRDGDGAVGVADHAAFLNGIALAAAAVVMTKRPWDPGVVSLADVARQYLDAAERAGLEFARFRRP